MRTKSLILPSKGKMNIQENLAAREKELFFETSSDQDSVFDETVNESETISEKDEFHMPSVQKKKAFTEFRRGT